MSARVSDLAVQELRDLSPDIICELVEEAVEERLGMLVDPDEGLELRPELAECLREYLAS